MPEEIADEEEVAKKAVDAKSAASVPDVCKTPSPAGPVPIPYPNIAQSSETKSGSKKVKTDGQPALTKNSSYKKSSGDEPGHSNLKTVDRVKKIAGLRIFKIPLWIWGFSLLALLAATLILLNLPPSLEPFEPLEPVESTLL